MTRWVALRAVGALALLAVPMLVFVLPTADADHGSCPAWERKRYDFRLEFRLAGDLFAVERLVGFADFRECYELRNHVSRDDVKFEARGGAYALRVVSDLYDEKHVLRGAANATRWYDLAGIDLIQHGGVSQSGEASAEAGVELPVKWRDRRA